MAESRFGELVSEMIFSPNEYARILKSLADENSTISKAFQLALKHPSITEPKFCAWAAKKLNLRGDRVGGEVQREKIINRCKTFVATGTSMGAELFWGIYRSSIASYVAAKLPSLQKLLFESKHDSSKFSSQEVFKKIVSLRTQYKVPLSEIQCLYEVWGFDRDSSVEELIKESAPAVNSEQLEHLQTLINILEEQFKNKFTEIEKHLSKTHSEIEEETESNSTQISEVKKDLIKLGTEFNSRLNIFGIAVENIRKNVRSLQDQKVIKALKSEIEKLNDRQTASSNAIAKLEESAVKQFKELSRVNEKIGRKFISSSSSESNSVRKVDAGKNQITEIEFVQYWHSKLKKTPFENLPIDDLLAAHILFKLFPCFLLNDSMLFDSWIATLGWTHFCKTAVAEPTWIKSTDCRELVSFVIADEAPTVLKIAQFNSAIPDGYLLPSAISWLSAEEFIDRKLALVATTDDDSSLREVVSRFPFLMSKYGRLEPGPIISKRPANLNIGNDKLLISTLAIWPAKAPESMEGNREILNVLKSLDLEIPPTVLLNFTKLKEAYLEFFDPSSALLSAYQFTIYPWLRYCANEVHAEQISQNLKVLYG